MVLELTPERREHHRRRDPDTMVLLFPERRGWWAQMLRERTCRRLHGHCFHAVPERRTAWCCCMCAGETEGFPEHECAYCPDRGRPVGYA